jgi:hypothetical protein
MVEAGRYLARAGDVVATYAKGSVKRRELEARLESNRGNLNLEAGELLGALAHYRRSLKLFTEIGDQEHIGIAHLKIAEACVRGADDGADAGGHLDIAESIFIHLGWIEGQARVLEQRVHYFVSLANSQSNTAKRTSYRGQAASAARSSRSLFQRVRHQAGTARIDSLMAHMDLRRVKALGAAHKVLVNNVPQLTSPKRRR